MARAERKKVKAQEKIKEHSRLYSRGQEIAGGTELGGHYTENKGRIWAIHSRSLTARELGDPEICGSCERRPGSFFGGRPLGCYYCPEKLYCTELCQAKDWPEHKKNCNMGKEETGSRSREVQVLKGSQRDKNEELGKPGLVRCFLVQGRCIVSVSCGR